MELRHLRYFTAVADQGSFSGAARKLHVAQSAISEQLANLEHEIGAALFVRSGRKTELTPAGKAFLEEARQTLSSANHAIDVAQRVDRGEAGTIRIGFFAGGVGLDFPRLIHTFRRQHARVRLSLVEMTPKQQWTALVERKIDVGFTRRLEPEFRSELKAITLHQDPIVAILPKNHPAAPGPVDLRDLAQVNIVLS
jgi:DNA-binding transcriptional LysR family regulator